jgi:hypothetical protein
MPRLLNYIVAIYLIVSRDGGDSWQRFEEGLRHRYLWSIAIDTANADNIILSAPLPPIIPILNRRNRISIGEEVTRHGKSCETACPSRLDTTARF